MGLVRPLTRAPVRPLVRALVGVNDWSPLSLGASLLAWWDSSVGVALSGAAVTSWTDRKAGLALAQGTGVNRPTFDATSFNGVPGVTFDGVDDSLTLDSAALPSGANPHELWAVVQQDELAGNAGVRTIFIFGGTASNTARSIGRTNNNVLFAYCADGASSSAASAPGSFAGRQLARARTNGTNTFIQRDGGAEASIAQVPATGSTRMRMGAFHTGTSQFWLGKIRDVIVTGALSADQAAQLQKFLLARRMV